MILYPFQKHGVCLIEHLRGRALLADDMGLGKTAQALAWSFNHPDQRPVVIVCPASIKWVWKTEAKHWGIKPVILAGRNAPGVLPANYFVLNYDILPSWIPCLRAIQPKLIILDEAHMLGNRNSQRTKAVVALCQDVPHVLALTGTPLTSRPLELWPILHMIRPDLFPNFWPFALRYCGSVPIRGRVNLKGASHLAELHQILRSSVMIRRRKEDVLTELPLKRRAVVSLDLEEYKEYHCALKHLTPSLDQLQRRNQIGLLKQLIGRRKLPMIKEWIANFLASSDSKLVAYTWHRHVLGELVKAFPGAVSICGDTSSSQRQQIVQQFQGDSKTRLLVGNLRATGQGLTLTAADTVVFTELGWTPGEHLQAEDRINRIGQTRLMTCYYLIARQTMEETIWDLLGLKQAIVSTVVDGHPVNVFDALYSSLERTNHETSNQLDGTDGQ